MRNKLYALAISITFVLFGPLTYAASCNEDVMEMRDQIYRYRSITTLEHEQISLVDSVSGFGFCKANGYNDERSLRKLTWEMHNWGNTLHSYALVK